MKDSTRALIDLLTEGTRGKKLEWESDANTTYFLGRLPTGTVELLPHPSGDGVNLLVRNSKGLLIEETGYLSQKANPQLADLHKAVRDSLINTDEQLTEMISKFREKLAQN
jgi:hypothetical protein